MATDTALPPSWMCTKKSFQSSDCRAVTCTAILLGITDIHGSKEHGQNLQTFCRSSQRHTHHPNTPQSHSGSGVTPPCLSFKGLPTDPCCPFLPMSVCLLVLPGSGPHVSPLGPLTLTDTQDSSLCSLPWLHGTGLSSKLLAWSSGIPQEGEWNEQKKTPGENSAACLLRLFLRGQCTATVRNSQQPHPESCQMLLQISMILRPWSLFLPCQIYWITSAK